VDLYEYQGKELLGGFGIPVGEGALAATPAEAVAAAASIGGTVALKAQVHSGGRGKAGGIRLATGPAEVSAAASAILELEIGGEAVRQIWLEPAAQIAREYYLSVTFDRAARQSLLMFATEGGVEIEQVAAERPETLTRVYVDPLEGFMPRHGEQLVAALPVAAERAAIAEIAAALYRCYEQSDATLCEVNPLIVGAGGELRALDAKLTIDDAALYRHPELERFKPPDALDTLDGFAHAHGVTYVKLNGTVGILGNGAGLSMSTVDVVVVAGGSPANFCDLGGGGSADGVVASLEVIARDPQVRVILFNIFGGITRCDEVARGILTALERLGLEIPIVVRLDGTNAAEGLRLLQEAARPNLTIEATMLAAAQRAVELAA
jgi:succinyl-CoA synthetase beta subunit